MSSAGNNSRRHLKSVIIITSTLGQNWLSAPLASAAIRGGLCIRLRAGTAEAGDKSPPRVIASLDIHDILNDLREGAKVALRFYI